MKQILVTGAAGFIGSNFVRRSLELESDWQVVALDALTYAGNLENLKGLEQDPRFEFVRGDICEGRDLRPLFERGLHAVVNFAAESHVDRSIHESDAFVRTNVMGVQQLLDLACQYGVERFVQISTDEVYGSIEEDGRFTESSSLEPSSPYSASKAAADLLVQAYHRTHGVPGIVTRCSNNYGPYQFPEKIIPLFVTNLLEQRPVPLYGDGLNVRDWIHVHDHCDAIRLVVRDGRPGEVYNVGAGNERTNLELTRAILGELGCDESMIRRVPDRKAHDRRYAVDPAKIMQELGWAPRVDFASGLSDTIRWYREHQDWWQAVKSGEYRKFYELHYRPEPGAGPCESR